MVLNLISLIGVRRGSGRGGAAQGARDEPTPDRAWTVRGGRLVTGAPAVTRPYGTDVRRRCT